MIKGDIVLIPIPFTDLSGIKNRPAVVLIDSEDDVMVCFLSTKLKWQSDCDILLKPTKLNGLKKTSIIRINKLATVDKELIIGLLGRLDEHYQDLLDKSLLKILKISK
jgi:mRNA interferase MazF